MIISESPTLVKYKETMRQCIRLYYPEAPDTDINAAIDYSINKRLQNANAKISNSYKRYKITKTDQFGNPYQEYVEPTQNISLLKLLIILREFLFSKIFQISLFPFRDIFYIYQLQPCQYHDTADKLSQIQRNHLVGYALYHYHYK